LRLTPRDLNVLRFAARHGMVTPEQLATRFFTAPPPALRRLRALEAAGTAGQGPCAGGSPTGGACHTGGHPARPVLGNVT
jgi:hypothetical protein